MGPPLHLDRLNFHIIVGIEIARYFYSAILASPLNVNEVPS